MQPDPPGPSRHGHRSRRPGLNDTRSDGRFASPIADPPELVPERWRLLLGINPVAGAVGLLRSTLVDAALLAVLALVVSGAAAAGFLLALLHFRRAEREFADIIR